MGGVLQAVSLATPCALNFLGIASRSSAGAALLSSSFFRGRLAGTSISLLNIPDHVLIRLGRSGAQRNAIHPVTTTRSALKPIVRLQQMGRADCQLAG